MGPESVCLFLSRGKGALHTGPHSSHTALHSHTLHMNGRTDGKSEKLVDRHSSVGSEPAVKLVACLSVSLPETAEHFWVVVNRPGHG